MRESFARLTRGLRRRPGYSLAIAGSLALALGLNSAVFAVIESVLLRPLPFSDEERLITIGTRSVRDGEPQAMNWLTFPRDIEAWRHSRVLERFAIVTSFPQTIIGRAGPENVEGARVSVELLEVLGGRMTLGRWFVPEDIDDRVVVLSDALWERQYARDSTVVGATLRIVGEPWTIIGVLERGHELPVDAQYWRPTRPEMGQMVARLRPDVSMTQAAMELEALSPIVVRARNRGDQVSIVATPLREYLFGSMRPALRLLLAAAGLLLLLGTANVASLSLGRALQRRREFAVRMSLGASRRSLVTLLFKEHLVLATVGLVLALVLAHWTSSLIGILAPVEWVRGGIIGVGQTTVLAAGTVALVAALLVSVAPIGLMRHNALVGVLSGADRTSGRTGTYRARRVLVSAQLAIAVLLICGSGLLIRSIMELTRRDRVGFAPTGVVIATMPMFGEAFRPAGRREAALAAITERARTLPGVTSIALGPPPLVGGRGDGLREGFSMLIYHREPGSSDENAQTIWVKQVDEGYLRTYRIPLLAGRDLAATDDTVSEPVALINATAARLFFTDGISLGMPLTAVDRMRRSMPSFRTPRVVGVVGDALQRDLTIDAHPEVYMPARQMTPLIGSPTIALRTATPASTLTALRRIIRDVDPTLAPSRLETMDDVIAASLSRHRFLLLLVGSFGGLAFVIAAIGLYAIVAYFVAERTREIGIRIALGAQRRHLYALVLGEGFRLVAFGAVVGLLAALALASLLRSFLFGVGERDPLTLGAAAVVLVVVSLLATWLPARAAASLQPSEALRAD